MKKRKKPGGVKSYLHDPTQLLGGKRLSKAANQLTRLELRPAIQGYLRQERAIANQRRASEAGLYNLGTQTGQRVAGAYGALKGSSDQNYARQQALAQMLNQGTSQINNQAAQNLAGMQTGQLGGITESLSARNVAPGGSASQAALAQQAQAQQQAAAQNAQAQGAFAQAQGGAFQGLAAGQAHAAQMRGTEAQADIANMIAQRIAESNLTHRTAELEAFGKRKDAKALWGATRLKNLLSLRGSEREYDLAKNPPTSKNLNVYKGLGKGKTAKAMVQVEKLRIENQRLRNKGYKNLPRGGGRGGGGGGKRG